MDFTTIIHIHYYTTLYMYVCIHTHTHTYVRTYIHIYIHTHTHTHTYVRTYVRTYIYTHTHTHTHIQIYLYTAPSYIIHTNTCHKHLIISNWTCHICMLECTVKTSNYTHINVLITMVTTLFYFMAAVSTFYNFNVLILYIGDQYIVVRYCYVLRCHWRWQFNCCNMWEGTRLCKIGKVQPTTGHKVPRGAVDV
jgi:hypothetical protein